MKRLLFLICTLLCANVLFAQTFWIDSLQYNVTSINPAEVKVYDANSSITTANIPATVTYNGTTYSVTSIGYEAFYFCWSLTSVTIPNSVTSIGERAFLGCRSLTSVTIPNSVTSIGNRAFYGCRGLTSVTIPNSVTSIGNNAFRNAGVSSDVVIDSVYYKVTPATIPESYYATLTDDSYTISGYGMITFHIGDSTYAPPTEAMVYDCKQNRSGHVDILSAIEFQENTYPVTSIGEDAFAFCWSLTSVTIPNSVTSIGTYAFEDCSSLTSITIPNSVTSIGDSAFYYCRSLTSVTIPNSVTSIGYGTFKNCSSLASVTIPNSVTSIGNSAFSNCSSLTSVTIPNIVTSIGNSAFCSCI